MRRPTLYLFIPLLFGCAALPPPGPDGNYEKPLSDMRSGVEEAAEQWKTSLGDPYIRLVLKHRYNNMQWLCRKLANRPEGFTTPKEKELCAICEYPFDIYFNELFIEANNLREQLFEIKKEGTIANDYYSRPSEANLSKLRDVFDQVHRYYVGKPYTWSRYINKFLFQKSRSEHFRKEFEARDGEFLKYMNQEARGLMGRLHRGLRAKWAYKRLKRDFVGNDLPPAGEVNALYRSRSLEEYHTLKKEEEEWARLRKEAGREKEVVIFVHGLGQSREGWGKFPELLAAEDIENPDAKKWFKVYVFSYDTVEDSKSVVGFRRELEGFIDWVRKDEGVEKVNLIGHSFGGVLSVKYIVQGIDGTLGLKEDSPALGLAGVPKVLDAYLEKGYRNKVRRFIGMAPSISGSQYANIAAAIFKKPPPLYRKRLPPLRQGVPGFGDIQIMENQLGSDINIYSFSRMDTERPFDPQDAVGLLPPEKRAAYTERDIEILRTQDIKTLCVIGTPRRADEFFCKSENDGLVKTFSANLNHSFLIDRNASRDIGYKKAKVRYALKGHFPLIEVRSRNAPAYGYALSFLNDELTGQREKACSDVRHFASLLRVFPEGVDPWKDPEIRFGEKKQVHFVDGERLVLPPLKVKPVAGLWIGRGLRRKTKGILLYPPNWNPFSGVFFQEGKILVEDCEASLAYRLSAEGYENKEITVPVRKGETTYAVYIVLKKAEEQPESK